MLQVRYKVAVTIWFNHKMMWQSPRDCRIVSTLVDLKFNTRAGDGIEKVLFHVLAVLLAHFSFSSVWTCI
ncbi:hypothetical protein BT63DRAFT_249863 [Microthyrium microscopicum]|uniref:Uncharacterized protein n=1 Tax=Microthyrium microscopicum TaxID=703497 RepID=A0A6A6UCA4_9PEZI|nr:hypothetical protein BT63DRAFT_249863 [Microthyrium microscopicum]